MPSLKEQYQKLIAATPEGMKEVHNTAVQILNDLEEFTKDDVSEQLEMVLDRRAKAIMFSVSRRLRRNLTQAEENHLVDLVAAHEHVLRCFISMVALTITMGADEAEKRIKSLMDLALKQQREEDELKKQTH